MRIIGWCGASLLALVAVFSQAQAPLPVPQSTPSASGQSTSEAKAGEATAQQPAGSAVSKDRARDSAGDSAEPRHHFHLRLGAITVGAGYWSGGPYYPYYAYAPYDFYPYAFYSPWLWGPYWSGPPLAYPGDGKGEVRLTSEPKTAQVFLDGAYAGTADKLKSFWLDPGAYDLSLSTPNRESFHQRIYVLSGKSLKITAKLLAQHPADDEEIKP